LLSIGGVGVTVLVMTIGAPFDGVKVTVTTGLVGRAVRLVDVRIVLLRPPERLGEKVAFEAIAESNGVLVAGVSVVLGSDEEVFAIDSGSVRRRKADCRLEEKKMFQCEHCLIELRSMQVMSLAAAS
jgi:hypothetical protein